MAERAPVHRTGRGRRDAEAHLRQGRATGAADLPMLNTTNIVLYESMLSVHETQILTLVFAPEVFLIAIIKAPQSMTQL